MKANLTKRSLILLSFSMAGAVGGGLSEYIVLTPLWSASPPLSFTVIQPETGVPLQNFWIPVRAAIAIFPLLSPFLTWKEIRVRRLLLIGLGSYLVMRIWSGLFFIREMLVFQSVRHEVPSAGREEVVMRGAPELVSVNKERIGS